MAFGAFQKSSQDFIASSASSHDPAGRTRPNKNRCCTGATIDLTEFYLNAVLTIINLETADRGSQRVVPSGHETIMLSRLAYAIVGSVVVAVSFSGTLFALNWWSGNLSYDPLFTASIPSLATARPQEPAPSARPVPAAAAVATQDTPGGGLPKG